MNHRRAKNTALDTPYHQGGIPSGKRYTVSSSINLRRLSLSRSCNLARKKFDWRSFAPLIRTYEQTGAHVFVTDEVGAVQFHISADSLLTTSTWRGGNQLSALDSNHP